MGRTNRGPPTAHKDGAATAGGDVRGAGGRFVLLARYPSPASFGARTRRRTRTISKPRARVLPDRPSGPNAADCRLAAVAHAPAHRLSPHPPAGEISGRTPAGRGHRGRQRTELLPGCNYEQALQDLAGFETGVAALVVSSQHHLATDGAAAARARAAPRSVCDAIAPPPQSPRPDQRPVVRGRRPPPAARPVRSRGHGTPIFDVKPYVAAFDAFPAARQAGSTKWSQRCGPAPYTVEHAPLAQEQARWLQGRWQIDFSRDSQSCSRGILRRIAPGGLPAGARTRRSRSAAAPGGLRSRCRIRASPCRRWRPGIPSVPAPPRLRAGRRPRGPARVHRAVGRATCGRNHVGKSQTPKKQDKGRSPKTATHLER